MTECTSNTPFKLKLSYNGTRFKITIFKTPLIHALLEVITRQTVALAHYRVVLIKLPCVPPHGLACPGPP